MNEAQHVERERRESNTDNAVTTYKCEREYGLDDG